MRNFLIFHATILLVNAAGIGLLLKAFTLLMRTPLPFHMLAGSALLGAATGILILLALSLYIFGLICLGTYLGNRLVRLVSTARRRRQEGNRMSKEHQHQALHSELLEYGGCVSPANCNPVAHDGHTEVETCSCAAVRRVNFNGSQAEAESWDATPYRTHLTSIIARLSPMYPDDPILWTGSPAGGTDGG